MFYGCDALVKNLNATTNKDAPACQRDKTRVKCYIGTAQGMSWTLFFGAMAGAAVGVLNLAAVANGWKLNKWIEVLNAPVIALDLPDWLAWYDRFDLLAVVLYWTLIGLFLSLLFCLARDRRCRGVLLCGAGAGILIGYLNWLTLSRNWLALWSSFELLDRPVRPLEEAVRYRTFSATGLPYWRLTYVVYWLFIGLLLASLFCVVRMFVKGRKL